MDESVTGSVNSFGGGPGVAPGPSITIPAMHSRLPSVDKGVQSFVWAVVFFLYLFFGMKAVGVSGATAFIVALVAAFLIFVFVRTRSDDPSGRS